MPRNSPREVRTCARSSPSRPRASATAGAGMRGAAGEQRDGDQASARHGPRMDRGSTARTKNGHLKQRSSGRRCRRGGNAVLLCDHIDLRATTRPGGTASTPYVRPEGMIVLLAPPRAAIRPSRRSRSANRTAQPSSRCAFAGVRHLDLRAIGWTSGETSRTVSRLTCTGTLVARAAEQSQSRTASKRLDCEACTAVPNLMSTLRRNRGSRSSGPSACSIPRADARATSGSIARGRPVAGRRLRAILSP